MNMMDPELMRLAQEQMSRMSPADFAKIQQQVKFFTVSSRVFGEPSKHENMETEEPWGKVEIKPQNIGFGIGCDGKEESERHSIIQRRTLLLACSLNLMSCYLKTKQYDECIKEGSEVSFAILIFNFDVCSQTFQASVFLNNLFSLLQVLEHDAKNVKALYRRGQAYKELGQLEDAVSDLSKALEVTPDDETIADVLRDAKERLGKQGVSAPRRGLVIEEINEEAEPVSSNNNGSSSTDYSIPQSQKTSDSSKSQNVANNGDLSTNSEYLKALNNDPEAIRYITYNTKFHVNFISNADPSTLAALNPGNSGEISPDMIKTASQMISKMSPGELQRMIGMASSYQGASSDSNFNSFKPGSVPNVTPDMFKTASDMMSKMPPEELQKMFERTSLKGSDPFTRQAAPSANRQNSDAGPKYSSDRENSEGNGASAVGETSSRGMFSNSRSIPLQSSFPSSAADLQEQMRNQMKDPATRQMFASMMKNMSPEMMANMSEQFGLKLSQEDAAKAQQAMSSLSPEDLDKMMRWADRIQKVAEGAKKTKNWLLGRPGMILAIFMLILAVILHRLGYIGS
ncbi:hypothetical protein FEM48_Zijuj02G0011000 [Ziziphus jujuba var. spinosa]|uniref:Outer envelope protein 61 n=1 Tax=Ziziphus jujuba var. spinosa TaxID=714518 RepID=A0A978VSQ3_ZIZJJ|nr:hypothetical protein FEM48_Zijuj02G0011000 [Ziziphus jujuba var. spinosa]